MLVSLTVLRYKKRFIPFAILSMVIFRPFLWFNKSISFSKLMGSGKNGTFDKTPDWQQWAILTVSNKNFDEISALDKSISILNKFYGNFINKWIKLFNCSSTTYLLQPIEGHGLWDGKKVFGNLPPKTDYEGQIAVLTRATIKLSKLNAFWKNVGGVAVQMSGANGFVTSYGIGEIPWIKQATFSIWQSKAAMKDFAYKMQEHKEVIVKTRTEKWYSEDMFTRFKILYSTSSLNK
jgi:hypothetical protein